MSSSDLGGEGEASDPFTSIPAAIADEPLEGADSDGESMVDADASISVEASAGTLAPVAGQRQIPSETCISSGSNESLQQSSTGLGSDAILSRSSHGRAIASTSDLPPLVPRLTR